MQAEPLEKPKKSFLLAWLFSGLFHGAIVGFMLMTIEWESKPEKTITSPIYAVAVNEVQIQQALNKRKEIEAEKKKKLAKEKKRLADIKKKKAAEKQRIKDQQKKKAQEEVKRKETEKKALVAKKLADEKRAKEKKTAEKKQAEKKRQEEVKKQKAAEAKKKKVAEEKRKKDIAEKKRKAEAAEILQLEEEARLEQLAAEEAEVNAARQKLMAASTAKYTHRIRKKIERNWVKPPGSAGLYAVIKITSIPGGGIGRVDIVKSSGNAIFDRSIVAAVRKSDPLPLPPDPTLFNAFKVFTLTFGASEN